jgi:hypothetical protein
MDATARRNLLFFTIVAAGAAGMFIVPWSIPVMGAPVVSDSYMVGFVNWVSAAALLLMAAALAWSSARLTTGSTGCQLWRDHQPYHRRWSIASVVALTGSSVLSAILLATITRGVAYGETAFFLDRMAQSAAGYRPFIDFGYGYTLGGLYGQVWLWRLLGPEGQSPLTAYYGVYLGFALVSFWMLYLLVTRLALSDRECALILVCLGGPSVLNATLGIQYLLVRYTVAPLVLVALHLWFTSDKHSGRRRAVTGALIALGGLALTLLLASPEMAIALFAGTVGYLAVLRRRERETALLAGVVYVGCLLPLAVFGNAYFALARSFASGAYNLPVLPGPPAVLYLLAVATLAILLPAVLRGSGPAGRPLTVGLTLLAAALVPAALGRADAGHILLNGLVVFVLAAAFLARLRPRLFVPFLAAVLVVFGGAQYLGVTRAVPPLLLSAVATSGSLSDSEFATLNHVLAWPWGTRLKHPQSTYALPKSTAPLSALGRYRSISAPLGLYPSDYPVVFRLAAEHRLAFDPVGGTGFTQGDLSRRTVALSHADCLLVPLPLVTVVEQSDPQDTPALVRGSTSSPPDYLAIEMFPIRLAPRNPQPNLAGELVVFVKQRFRRAGTWGNYAVYVPRDGTAEQ